TFEIPGAVRLKDLTAVAINLPEGFERTQSGGLAGFVGYDLLSRFVVRIDYGNRKITFYDPATWTPAPSDGTPLMLNLDNDVPSITAQFENLPPAQFLLDTGDESTLRMYGPYVTQNKLDVKYPKGIVSVGGGIGGESRSRVARIESFTVAGVTLHGIPTEFSQDAKGGASQILAGSLGSKLLSRFVVTFDYAHSRVFFTPTPAAAKPFNTHSYGLTLTSETIHGLVGNPQTIIVDVAPGSPAERAGIIVGDRILQIDGQSPHKLGLAGVRHLLTPDGAAATRTLLLLSPDGKQRSVRIMPFDPLG
ncbi:MAG: PDZ domain-containing protein, partial [Armatimonadota bacterium]|nr:PDZ domain-containing protein [Armatimonadota bacterium]